MSAFLSKITKKNHILNSISWTMLAKVFAMLFYFLTDIVIANNLSVDEYGSWNYYFSLKTMLAYFCYLGINQATKIMIARAETDSQKAHIFRLSLKIRVIVNILFAVLIAVSTHHISMLLAVLGNNYVANFLLYFSGLLAVFTAFQEFFKATAYGLNNSKLACEFTAVEYGITFLCIAVFVIIFKNNTGVLIAYVVAGIGCLSISLVLLDRKTHLLKPSSINTQSQKIVGELFKYAIPLLIANLADLVSEFDIIMLGNYSDAEQIALYNIGKKICTKAGQINLAIATGSMMSFALINKTDAERKLSNLRKIFKFNLIITLLVSVLLVPIAIWGIPLFYGNRYLNSTYTTLCFIPYYFLYGNSILSAFFVDFRGKSSIRSAISILAIGLNIVLNFIFIPKWGAIGAVITTIIAQASYAIFLFFETIHLTDKIVKLYQ